MGKRQAICAVLLSIACTFGDAGQYGRGQSAPAGREASLKEFSATLPTLLVQAMPSVLYEGSSNWGHTSPPPKWRRKHREPRNDGTWRKIKLSTRNPAQSLSVELRDWKYPDADHMTFTAALALDAGVDFEQQIWESGIR